LRIAGRLLKQFPSLPMEDNDGICAYCDEGPEMSWLLRRAALIWLILTAVIIAAVLHSVYLSNGFH